MLNDRSTEKLLGTLHVAELARQADVTPATVRYYARVGLLSPGREPENGYRCFSSDDLHRVVFIRQAQALGLTIGDIRIILEGVDRGKVPCHQVKSLVEQRLIELRGHIAELRDTEQRITRALATWQAMSDVTPKVDEFCPLIERLDTLGREVTNGSRNGAKKPSGVRACHSKSTAMHRAH